MAERLSNFSNSYFAYANYWRPSARIGTTLFHSRSLTKTDKLQMKPKWQIITIASCVIIAVTLVIGIYNAVIYKNASISRTTHIRTSTSDDKSTTSTTSTVAAAATTVTDTITSTTTTTATATVAIATTSPAAVSTAAVTTNTPLTCPTMLPFGDEAGDAANPMVEDKLPFPSFQLWGKIADSGEILMVHTGGIVELQAGDQALVINILSDDYDVNEWFVYYRTVSLKSELDAIGCLVKESDTLHAAVITFVKDATKDTVAIQALQLILANNEQYATYVIRIYSENLPDTAEPEPVKIMYRDNDCESFLTDVKVDDVKGQRQIFDVTGPVTEAQNLTVVEEGKNCDIFIC